MKRILSLILRFVFCAGFMTACTGGKNPPQATPLPQATPQPTPARFEYKPIEQPIQWKDETFKKLVYSGLGKDLSEDVCPQDLLGITFVLILSDKEIYFGESCLQKGVTAVPDANGNYKGLKGTYSRDDMVKMSLDDLFWFTSVRDLRVALVDSGDIQVTGYMYDLKYLYMNSCNIQDISPIADCTNLMGVNFTRNNISDISVFGENFVSSIYLDHNNISDLSVFAPMTKLPHEMNFAYNNISDITPLARGGRQEALAHLSLRDNNISDISPLKDYVNISILSLTNNNITDVSPLKNLAKGNNIYLVNNPVTNYEELAGFYNVSK